MVTEIFDRIEILQVIETEWLGAPGGSGVLLCPQKVGKSFLLDHIFSRNTENQGSIFCKINLDYLLTALSPGETLSDQVFLGFFLRRLRDRIRSWTLQEAHWSRELAKTDAQLEELKTAVEPDAISKRTQLQKYLKMCQNQIEEIVTLKELSVTINDLLKNAPIGFSAVGEVLYTLDSIRKRVVLFIDDYHKMVSNPAFSKALFTFLRGADQQKHLITLVSSQLQLMDPSLHAGDSERSQLFNHFQPRLLEPFTDQLSLSFLAWPGNFNPPLTDEEKSYLTELGGRLPYFLRIVKDEFVREGRPDPGAKRSAFENLVSTVLEPAFSDIWLRCPSSRRSILKSIATEDVVVPRKNSDFQDLEKEGYIVKDAPFSRLFCEFIKKQSGLGPLEDVEATVTFTYEVFPTALAYGCSSESLLTFGLSNGTSEKINIQLSCDLKLYTQDPTTRLVPVPAKTLSHTEELPVTPDTERVKELQVPKRGLVHYRAEWLDSKRGRLLRNDTAEILVLPLDYFIFARRNKVTNTLTDFTWLIAAWVQKAGNHLEQIKKAAREKHPEHALGGYRNDVPDPAAHVRAQVHALYEALKDHGLAYDNNAMTLYASDSDFTQRVRLPKSTLEAKAGNCLEGSVLFASLLFASDLHPIILFIPGHAVVGWKTRDAANAAWEFLDTTVIANTTFENACKIGQALYEERKQQCVDWEECAPAETTQLRQISDHKNFAIPVLIGDVYKSRNLTPLPTL